MAVKKSPFGSNPPKPMKSFGARKGRARKGPKAKAPSGANGRTCEFAKGMRVKMTWKIAPEYGGGLKMAIGTVIDVQWTESGATVVFKEKNGGVMRHSLFAPGNSKLRKMR